MNAPNFNKVSENPTPFVYGIDTQPERRVYTFVPEADKFFLIIAALPHANYDWAFIKVVGEQIDPEMLIAAVKFVTGNEAKYNEAEDLSAIKEALEPVSEKISSLTESSK